MKALRKLVLMLGVAAFLFSCQSTNTVLSKSEKRTQIMNAIANDESMSEEMMEMLMKNKMKAMDQKSKKEEDHKGHH